MEWDAGSRKSGQMRDGCRLPTERAESFRKVNGMAQERSIWLCDLGSVIFPRWVLRVLNPLPL